MQAQLSLSRGGEGQEETRPHIRSCPLAVSVGVGRDGDDKDEDAGCPLPARGQRLHLEAVGAGVPQQAEGEDDATSPLGAEGKGAARLPLQQREEGMAVKGRGLGEVHHGPAGSDAEGQGEQLVPQRGGTSRAAVWGAETHTQPARERGDAEGCQSWDTGVHGAMRSVGWAPAAPQHHSPGAGASPVPSWAWRIHTLGTSTGVEAHLVRATLDSALCTLIHICRKKRERSDGAGASQDEIGIHPHFPPLAWALRHWGRETKGGRRRKTCSPKAVTPRAPWGMHSHPKGYSILLHPHTDHGSSSHWAAAGTQGGRCSGSCQGCSCSCAGTASASGTHQGLWGERDEGKLGGVSTLWYPLPCCILALTNHSQHSQAQRDPNPMDRGSNKWETGQQLAQELPLWPRNSLQSPSLMHTHQCRCHSS